MNSRQWAILIAILACVAWIADSATITRGPKSGTGGTTEFGDATVIKADEMNTDFNNIYNLVNGELDNANIKAAAGILYSKLTLTGGIVNADVNASANIAYSKFLQTAAQQDADIVDDYSFNDAEQVSDTSPGTSDSLTNALNLEQEIAMLRYKIHSLTVGNSASFIATGAGTTAYTSWADGPARGPNLIYNGGFDDLDTLDTSTDGDGWVRVKTPTTLQAIALTESEKQGDGQGVHIIDLAENSSGISQTLDGLKASTRYLARVSVKDVVGTCTMSTTGADTNQLTVTSDDTGTWQVLAGVFTTDATPTNVVLQLLADAFAGPDECYFDHVAVYELSDDPLPQSIVISTAAPGGGGAPGSGAVAATYTDVTGWEVSLVVPRSNCILTIDAHLTISAGDGQYLHCRLEERAPGTAYYSDSPFGHADSGLSTLPMANTWDARRTIANPTPGATYTYGAECYSEAAKEGSDTPNYDCGITDADCPLTMNLICGG